MLRMDQYKYQIAKNLNANKRHQMNCLLILHVIWSCSVSSRGCIIFSHLFSVEIWKECFVTVPDIDQCVILSRKCEERRCKAVFKQFFSFNKLNFDLFVCVIGAAIEDLPSNNQHQQCKKTLHFIKHTVSSDISGNSMTSQYQMNIDNDVENRMGPSFNT